jgi:methionine synthase II (cobalamin-independent)
VIRAANHSSYPRFGDYPPDEQLRELVEARRGGADNDAEITAVADEVVSLVVAEQSRAFIDIVTDGMIRWDGPLSLLTTGLEGLEPGGDTIAWPGSAIDEPRPVSAAPVGHRASFLSHGLEVAVDVAQTPVKTVLPGPVTCARLVDDRHYGDRVALARAIAAALASEVAVLATAGARHFQLDEPLLGHHPEDLELVAETARVVFEAAGAEATTVLSTYTSGLGGVADGLATLPGTHLGLDLVDGGNGGLELLGRVPEGRGLFLGLWDASTGEAEDAVDVAERLLPHRDRLTARDVIVGPNAGLAGLSRDDAFDKLLQVRYLVEKLRADWNWK